MPPIAKTITRFDGGLNSRYASHLINDNQTAYERNVDRDGADAGACKKRNGYTLHGTLPNTPGRVTGIQRFYYANGTSRLIATGGTRTYEYSGGAWAALSAGYTSDLRFGFCMYQNLGIFGNGVDATKKLAAGAGAEANLGGTPPVASLFAVYREKVFAAGNPSFPSRLYWSATTNAEDWTTSGDAGNVDIRENDGDAITAIVVQQDRLIIFKNFSTWALYFTDATQFYYEPLSLSIGCVAAHTVVNYDGYIIWLHGMGSSPKAVYGMSRNQMKCMSDNIENLIEGTTSTYLQQAAAARYKNSYLLAVNLAGTSNDTVLPAYLGGNDAAWSYWSGMTFSAFWGDTRNASERILAGSAVDGRIYTLDSGLSDNPAAGATNINFVVRSRAFFFDVPELPKYVYRVDANAKSADSVLTFNCYKNGVSQALADAWTFSNAGEATEEHSYDIAAANGRGRSFQAEFAANNQKALTLYGYTMMATMDDLGRDGN